MTIETLKNLLKSYKLNPNKTYGQHFLMDETILEDMIDEAKVKAGDMILEIGPGIGNLTERLLEHKVKVLSIEKDPQFLPVLKTLQKEHEDFSYELTDALKYNFSDRLKGTPYKVIANIPYYITGKIVQLFMHAAHKPDSLTLLMQKEVAYNIAAKPGSMNLIAISVQLFADARVVCVVPGHKFHPAPKVDSAVIHITLHKKPKYKIKDEAKLFRILRACFSGKRKQLHNTLENNLQLSKQVVTETLSKLKIDPMIRPQQLTIEQWLNLCDELKL
ncbi:MAG TPA: 16S rRNA (adenine(1518)-N(6)/adenine(1519)-N(6))-dimethyltransferase RsmA [Patescibacteria group bacterium]|jgi:16S rRNA (adenine1518-N6/adenine1519-N6)-dimethyltransferase|nr:16S rRNA (adenine(1518)-N(6)/adenine(1519)-N(6))-dimethyltransferase RsmA [Patescibacteria group bacterium]